MVAMESPRLANARELTLAVLQEEQLGLPRSANNVFCVWMTSGLLGEGLSSLPGLHVETGCYFIISSCDCAYFLTYTAGECLWYLKSRYTL